ncbi:hypothetical protein N8865_01960 [Francisellaceae bacterium]|nr:hypothetical protein [Francisellaceae bacterium]
MKKLTLAVGAISLLSTAAFAHQATPIGTKVQADNISNVCECSVDSALTFTCKKSDGKSQASVEFGHFKDYDTFVPDLTLKPGDSAETAIVALEEKEPGFAIRKSGQTSDYTTAEFSTLKDPTKLSILSVKLTMEGKPYETAAPFNAAWIDYDAQTKTGTCAYKGPKPNMDSMFTNVMIKTKNF